MASTGKQLENNECISAALYELLILQEYIKNSSIPYFGKLLARLVEVDTIPFLLITKDGFLELMGTVHNKRSNKSDLFTTKFFRIEEMEKDAKCAKVSLLRPLDIYGEDTKALCDVARLTKTSTCVEIDLNCICAIQCVDLDLLKREFIVEPKW